MQGGSLQKEAAYGDTIKNLASRVESGARNAFQGLRNTPGIIKPLQQRNLARGAIHPLSATPKP